MAAAQDDILYLFHSLANPEATNPENPRSDGDAQQLLSNFQNTQVDPLDNYVPDHLRDPAMELGVLEKSGDAGVAMGEYAEMADKHKTIVQDSSSAFDLGIFNDDSNSVAQSAYSAAHSVGESEPGHEYASEDMLDAIHEESSNGSDDMEMNSLFKKPHDDPEKNVTFLDSRTEHVRAMSPPTASTTYFNTPNASNTGQSSGLVTREDRDDDDDEEDSYEDQPNYMRYASTDPEYEEQEKQHYMLLLYKLEKKGYILSRPFTMEDSARSMRLEYERHYIASISENKINYMKRIILMGVFTIELLNSFLGEIFYLKGWGASVKYDIDQGEYEDVLEHLARRYAKFFTPDAEYQLAFMLISSAVMFHVSNGARSIATGKIDSVRQASANDGGGGGGSGSGIGSTIINLFQQGYNMLQGSQPELPNPNRPAAPTRVRNAYDSRTDGAGVTGNMSRTSATTSDPFAPIPTGTPAPTAPSSSTAGVTGVTGVTSNSSSAPTRMPFTM